MSQIKFNGFNLNRITIPDIERTIDHLDKGIKQINTIYIPGDFKYKNYLQNLYYDMVNYKQILLNIKNFIYNSNKTLDDLLNDFISDVENIGDVDLQSRSSVIK